MTALLADAPSWVVRHALRARAMAAAPDGLVWLAGVGLAHPEAGTGNKLPFPFAIGRIPDGSQRRTVREIDLVLASLDGENDAADLTDYARFVVAHAPTIHARLTGRTLAAWQARGRAA